MTPCFLLTSDGRKAVADGVCSTHKMRDSFFTRKRALSSGELTTERLTVTGKVYNYYHYVYLCKKF